KKTTCHYKKKKKRRMKNEPHVCDDPWGLYDPLCDRHWSLRWYTIPRVPVAQRHEEDVSGDIAASRSNGSTERQGGGYRLLIYVTLVRSGTCNQYFLIPSQTRNAVAYRRNHTASGEVLLR